MRGSMRVASVVLVALAPLSAGCFSSEVNMSDQASALEQQASGSFDDLEKRLDRAAIEPRPVPLTPEQLAVLGASASPRADTTGLTEADRVDGLLVQHCVGEGADGLLADTHDECVGAADADAIAELVDRVNRSRKQLWKWMHERRADASVDDLRRGWREAHLRGVVCGGWIEGDDHKWQSKAC